MELNLEKSCENCRYYLKHYFIFKSKFRGTGCGHCEKKGVFYKSTKKVCEMWKDNSDVKSAREEAIKDALKEMRNSLSSIAQILNED